MRMHFDRKSPVFSFFLFFLSFFLSLAALYPAAVALQASSQAALSPACEVTGPELCGDLACSTQLPCPLNPGNALVDGLGSTYAAGPAGQPRVNITVALSGEYEVYSVAVTFASFLPGSAVLERSTDGATWLPWQYFAQDCQAAFGMTAQTQPSSLVEVICSQLPATQQPGGNLSFVLFTSGDRPELFDSDALFQFSLASHVRLRLLSFLTLP
jgi:hypothetical protein